MKPLAKGVATDGLIFAGLLALMVWLPLPWGSKPVPAAALLGAAVAILAAARLLLALRGLRLTPLPVAARLTLGLGLAWLVWTGLQLVPLSGATLARLSPAAGAMHAPLEALPGDPAYTLSIHPAATAQQWMLGASYLALFWLVLVLTARQRSRQRWVLMTVVLAGVGQALYGSLMVLTDWEYGFLGPKVHGLGRATGTFVNQNHFAGYLELGLAAGIALVLADLRPSERAGWREFLAGLLDLVLSRRFQIRVMLAMMVVALVLSRSRGGNLAFFVSLAACGGMFMLVRHPRYFGKSLIFFLSLFLVDVVIVSEHYGLDKLAQRIESTELDTEQRTLAFRDLQPLLSEYGLIGSGLGTFQAAFAPHRSANVHGDYDHAHNDHLEFLVEAGAIGYGLLCAIAVVLLVHGLALIRRRRDPMVAALGFAASMALTSLALHGLGDFNLRIPAVAATLIVLLALALGCSSTPRAMRDQTPRA